MSKSFSDTDVKIRVEMVDKNGTTMVNIYNDDMGPSGFVIMTFTQFQRLMAFGEFLCHPRF